MPRLAHEVWEAIKGEDWVLTAGTLLLTIGIAAWIRWEPLVAVTPDLADVAPRLEEHGLRVMITDEPERAVYDRVAWAAASGHEVILTGGGPKALALESIVRERAAASWRPDVDVPKPPVGVALAMGHRIVVLLGALALVAGRQPDHPDVSELRTR